LLYTRREVEQAKKAQEVLRRLGYPSPGALTELLQHGGMLNAPITSQDVQRALKIYGPGVAVLKGKTVRRPALPYKQESIPRLISVLVTLSVDLMFVMAHVFLLSISDHLGFTMITHLGRKLGARTKTSIRKALHEHFNGYKAHGFIVGFLHTDPEGAIASLSNELGGTHSIVVNPSGPGQHVPPIERKIREVKERSRSVIHSLPYTLTTALIVWLVFYCVRAVNMTIHTGGPTSVSPRGAFLGVKTDYDRDCRVSFGDYVEATDPYSDNTMKARTQSCIALLPTGTQGTVHMLSLTTGKSIKRDQFKILPPPDIVIAPT
jgi:hypothetical protein